jgi:hypothetical protein
VLERDDIERLVGAYKGERTENGRPLIKDLEPGPLDVAAAERMEDPRSR